MTFSKLKQLGAPPEDKDAYNCALKYAVHLNEHIKSGKGLIMMGPVGTGKTSLWVSSKVDSIISDRVERGKATIITTNLSVQQIKKCYDSRIYDRLKETSFILSFKGKSKRDPLDISQI